jgi:acid stress-induced BolA-like protein IbaG/YrbA
MEYILAIDDTDNLDSPGTGEHLENIIILLQQEDIAACSRVTRHQLFFSPLVNYTSHNSAMAATVTTDKPPEEVFDAACGYLGKHAAKGSDPGVCLLTPAALSDAQVQALHAYGRKAKTAFVEKQEAYDLALQCGIMLRELGGDGTGVIGALAGAALRMHGNDGRYKGQLDIGVNQDNMRCGDILSHPDVDCVMTEDGQMLGADAEVFIVERIKTVFLNHKAVLLVKKRQTPDGIIYINLCKSELKQY